MFGAQFRSDFLSSVGIPVAMGLFIDCHFLFEIQLFCLRLHIEVLSFEDSEWVSFTWMLENRVPSGNKRYGHTAHTFSRLMLNVIF